MTKTQLLDRFAHDAQQRIMLARALDKLDLAQNRGVPAHTEFLSPEQQALLDDMLRACQSQRHFLFGGFPDAERQICVFLPDWQEQEDWLAIPDGSVAALRCTFPREAALTHRDILGSLMGLGITRERLGDILMYEGGCDVLALRDILPILLTQWDSAGRWRLTIEELSLDQLNITPPKTHTFRDTVAALRLDAVVACGFSLSRSRSAELISGGRVMLNHRQCLKPDHPVAEGDVLTLRGAGKCVLRQILGKSKKARTMVLMEAYR